MRRRLKRRLLAYYCDTRDPEIIEALAFIRKYKLTTFNYEFIFAYEDQRVDVRRDETCGLFFVVDNGRRLYFKRGIKDRCQVEDYYNAMCKEQDVRSPHRYTDSFHDVDGGALLDLGAAEGLFSLRSIDKADFVYLFECDPGWLEALQWTFKPYASKVRIVPSYVSDVDNNREVRLDSFGKTVQGRISFVKMDIEGAEIRALQGARQLRRDHPDCKWSICTYHHPDDEIKVRELLAGCRIRTSLGYMLFYFDRSLKEPFFRRGVLYAGPA